MPDAASLSMTLADRAALLLVAKTELAAAERAAEALEAELLAAMEAELRAAAGDDGPRDTARRVEIPGAVVTYVPPGATRKLQEKRCVMKLEALGARLRGLGETDVDDDAPYTETQRGAYLKLTLRL